TQLGQLRAHVLCCGIHNELFAHGNAVGFKHATELGSSTATPVVVHNKKVGLLDVERLDIAHEVVGFNGTGGSQAEHIGVARFGNFDRAGGFHNHGHLVFHQLGHGGQRK